MRTILIPKLTAMVLSALAMATSASLAADGISNTFTPEGIQVELSKARDSIARDDFWAAITRLNDIVTADPRNADAHNLLGFSYRRIKKIELAERSYQRALRLEPKHRGALEYIGELYLETGRRAEAQAILRTLESVCPDGCDELDDLREAFSRADS